MASRKGAREKEKGGGIRLSSYSLVPAWPPKAAKKSSITRERGRGKEKEESVPISISKPIQNPLKIVTLNSI